MDTQVSIPPPPPLAPTLLGYYSQRRRAEGKSAGVGAHLGYAETVWTEYMHQYLWSYHTLYHGKNQ